MYHNFADMLSIAEEQKTSLWRVILQNEIKHSDLNEKEIFELNTFLEVVKITKETESLKYKL